MDWRVFSPYRAERGAEFYATALEYGNYLWQRRLAARAILCLDRAFAADLRDGEQVLRRWPLPYAAMAWILEETPPEVFIGNPRVHFQHYADRMNQPRREQRQWRAWACWAITRRVRPQLPPDPRHDVREPSEGEIESGLLSTGLAGEAGLWKTILGSATETGA